MMMMMVGRRHAVARCKLSGNDFGAEVETGRLNGGNVL